MVQPQQCDDARLRTDDGEDGLERWPEPGDQRREEDQHDRNQSLDSAQHRPS